MSDVEPEEWCMLTLDVLVRPSTLAVTFADTLRLAASVAAVLGASHVDNLRLVRGEQGL